LAGLIVIAHAPLATALRAAALHVYPDCAGRLAALDVDAGAAPEDVEAQARAALAAPGFEQALVMTDVFGATPCNVAMRLADGASVRVVAGVNVPMLWRALCYSEEALDDLVSRALAGGAQGVMPVSAARPQNQVGKPAFHDQVHHHHQQ
jgi:PTS system ascorbate-specific IIA component